MGTFKIFLKEKNKKELLDELKLIQERIADSELQVNKNKKTEKKGENNIKKI